MKSRNRAGAALIGLAIPLIAAPSALAGGTFTVNTTNDTVDAAPGNGKCADASGSCSLRAAIQEANAQGGTSTIRLASGATYTLSIAGAGENAAATGDLDVTSKISIQGKGSTVDAAGLDRAFDVLAGASLTVDDLDVKGGAPPATESGGAYRSVSTLRLDGGTLKGNAVTGAGSSGGAIVNAGGSLIADDVNIIANSAVRAGGGIEANAGSTKLSGVTLNDNAAGPTPGNGGGLHLTGTGTVSVDQSVVNHNTASAEGGGLWNSSTGSMTIARSLITNNTASGTGADQGGGGLFNDGDGPTGGTMTVDRSTVSGNKADAGSGSGGGILNDEGKLSVDRTEISSNTSRRAGGGVEANIGSTTLSRTTLSGNSAGPMPGNGGGLHLSGAGTVSVDRGVVTGNTASAEGGGLWNSATGTMDIARSEIRNNTASGAGPDQGGGGLFQDGDGQVGGTMTVDDSTISANKADGAAGSGGAVLNDEGNLTVERSQISSNTSVRAGGGIEANIGTTKLSRVTLNDNSTGSNPGNGGGLHLSGAGTVMIERSTIYRNSAAKEGGGLWNSSPGTMIVTRSSIFANTAVVIGNEGDGMQVFWMAPGTGVFTIDGSPVTPG